MLFSSLIFLFAFLPAVLFLYFVVFRKRKARNILLLLASLFFYAWGEPKFVFVMVLSIFVNYGLGLLVHRANGVKKKERAVIVLTVILNLSLLVYCKYLDFAIININFLLGTDIALRNVVLPIGISFFTFQAMSYVFDVHRGKGKVQKNPLNVALYISFFPQLIAGPIVRYETIAEQIDDRKESMMLFSEGTKRFIIGLAKKVLLANSLALVADKAFDMPEYSGLSSGFALLGAITYTLQIYYDFSGYSDMAIGLGKMFGFQFLENFNYPYVSNSISEFWRRWHISLSTWFRDYVYFPLGGSRVSSKGRLVFNLFVVWTLTGIWHGASWNFVLWGLLYFAFITFEKLTGIPNRFKNKGAKAAYRIFTLVIVVFGWILFRAVGMDGVTGYFESLFHLNGNALCDSQTLLYLRENIFILVMAVIFAFPIAPKIRSQLDRALVSHKRLVGIDVMYYIVLILLFLVCVSYLVKGSYNPFIYFNF
ncbi:MBOAT family protein [Christensenellaceae bacterium OttesenSCG-928-K19]|nr:MBOAT family protein [Christensenellaceae bacterium OttesenSCG-928-K19]